MSADLYQEKILALAHDDARAGRLDSPDATATVDNPLCGDRVTIDVSLKDGRIHEIAHHVRGCVLCQASAAALAAKAVGETGESLAHAAESLRAMLTGGAAPSGPWAGFDAFTPVAEHKSRHSCVLLPFDAVAEALSGKG